MLHVSQIIVKVVIDKTVREIGKRNQKQKCSCETLRI